jgi:hypothetical protein
LCKGQGRATFGAKNSNVMFKIDNMPSVSNPVYTDTGIPVFGTPNTDTGKNLPVFAGIETYKIGTFHQNDFLLKKKLGNIRLIYFVFTCKLALERLLK